MKISETVPLPDPDIQPLVHPLDIPEARRDFYRAWSWETFANPMASFLIAAIVWLVAGNWVAPLFAFAATFGFGWMARRWSLREAWEFIPRKRQDRTRPLPFNLALGSVVALAVLLALSIFLLILRLERGDLSDHVVQFFLGAGLIAVFFAHVIFGYELYARVKPVRQQFLGLIPLEVATIGLVIGFVRLLDGGLPNDLTSFLIGAAVMTVAGVVALVKKVLEIQKAVASEA